MKAYRRKHNLSRIKLDCTYEYHEVALLLNVSKSTVRNWIKLELPVMNAKRPPLINGAELKAFLQVKAITPAKLLVSGICECCERSVSKIQHAKNAPIIVQTFNVQEWQGESLLEPMPPHSN